MTDRDKDPSTRSDSTHEKPDNIEVVAAHGEVPVEADGKTSELAEHRRNRDHAAVGRERAAAEREAAAADRDQSQAEADQRTWTRGQAADDREHAAADRDEDASARDQSQAETDQRATSRGQAADDREQIAADRDQSRAEADERTSNRGQAAEDREHAAADRHGDGSDRGQSQAEADERISTRGQAAEDREHAALDREQTASDRGQSQAEAEHRTSNRGQSTSDRQHAAADREKAVADRIASDRDHEQTRAALRAAQLDQLTGAVGRGVGMILLEREINRARHGNGHLVLAYIDVDGLKQVNDRQGHAAGDALLRDVAGAIQKHLRSYDTLVRVGGDEFVCALGDCTPAVAHSRFQEIRATMAQAQPAASISVGFAELRPDDTLEQLTKRGDLAVYEAKRSR